MTSCTTCLSTSFSFTVTPPLRESTSVRLKYHAGPIESKHVSFLYSDSTITGVDYLELKIPRTSNAHHVVVRTPWVIRRTVIASPSISLSKIIEVVRKDRSIDVSRDVSTMSIPPPYRTARDEACFSFCSIFIPCIRGLVAKSTMGTRLTRRFYKKLIPFNVLSYFTTTTIVNLIASSAISIIKEGGGYRK